MTRAPFPSQEQWLRGHDHPKPATIPLRAGEVTAELVDCDLRHISIGGVEIAQRVYIATRDRNWGTLPIDIRMLELDVGESTFTVRCEVRQQERDIDITWRGTIHGDADGTIIWEVTAVPAVPCTYKLFGFNIHHGLSDYSGCHYVGATDAGPIEGTFPTTIAPQPVVNQTEVPIFPPVHRLSAFLRHRVAVTFTFEGAPFEFEDQRNWTDASFKSQSFPPRNNGCFTACAGQAIHQRITIAPFCHAQASPPAANVGHSPIQADTYLPAIGLAAASHGHPLDVEEAALIAALRPNHLLGELDLAQADWPNVLERHAADVAAIGCDLALAITLSSGAEPRQLAALVHWLPDRVSQIRVFHHAEECTDPIWLDHLRILLGDRIAAIVLVGGTRTDFCELNRHRQLGRDHDGIAWGITPQVHAFDDRSLVENLPGIGETVRTAHSFAGNRPLFTGPITLKPRTNPSATEIPAPVTAWALPPEVDPRQLSLLGAGWTLGVVAQLATAGVAAITLFETTGWRGVIQGSRPSTLPDRFPSLPGMVFPLYHLLADLAEMPSAIVTMAELNAGVITLGLRTGTRQMILMANLTAEHRWCSVSNLTFPTGAPVMIRRLTGETVHQAAIDPAGFRAHLEHCLLADYWLSPFEVVTATIQT